MAGRKARTARRRRSRVPVLLGPLRRRGLVTAVVAAVAIIFVLSLLLGFQVPSLPSR